MLPARARHGGSKLADVVAAAPVVISPWHRTPTPPRPCQSASEAQHGPRRGAQREGDRGVRTIARFRASADFGWSGSGRSAPWT
jgi:hypothetical protein